MRGGFSVSRFFFVICRIVVVICLFVARCRQTNESCHWQKIGCWKDVWINLNLAHGKKCINIHNIHTIACTKASIDLNVIGNLNANIDVNNIGTEWRKNDKQIDYKVYLSLSGFKSAVVAFFGTFVGFCCFFGTFLAVVAFLALSYYFLLAIRIGSSVKSKPPTVQVTPFSHFIQMICFNLHLFFWWNVCSVLCHGMVVSVVQFPFFVLALDSRLVFYPEWTWVIEVICLAKFWQWKVISKLWRQN